MYVPPQVKTTLARRRFLQGTLSGVAGLAAWHGWPDWQRAMAQKGEPTGQMTWTIHVTITGLFGAL